MTANVSMRWACEHCPYPITLRVPVTVECGAQRPDLHVDLNRGDVILALVAHAKQHR